MAKTLYAMVPSKHSNEVDTTISFIEGRLASLPTTIKAIVSIHHRWARCLVRPRGHAPKQAGALIADLATWRRSRGPSARGLWRRHRGCPNRDQRRETSDARRPSESPDGPSKSDAQLRLLRPPTGPPVEVPQDRAPVR